MTDWPRGGYPAGDTPASELKPPPASMISPQRHVTRQERAIPWQVAEEIAEKLEKIHARHRIPAPSRIASWCEECQCAWPCRTLRLIRVIGTREATNDA